MNQRASNCELQTVNFELSQPGAMQRFAAGVEFYHDKRPLAKFAHADEAQDVDGAQPRSVHEVLDEASTGATQRFAAGVEFSKGSGFTLLEVLIALALIAILMLAAAPYMADAWRSNEGERIAESIEALAIKTRSQAILSGETQFIPLTSPAFLPKGWTLQVQRITDQKFRPPLDDELWQFNSEGICDPLSLRLMGGGEPIVMKFDPITGQTAHDEP